MYVWELASGEVVFGQRCSNPVSVVKWVSHYTESRRVVYECVIGVGPILNKGKFFFDQGRVQWNMTVKPYALPSGGLVRQFCSIETSEDNKYLYVGSTGSDVIIYRHDIAVFRALIPVGSNGVRSLVRMDNGDLLCGAGDGSITKLRGEDLSWEIIEKVSNVPIALISYG